MLEKRVADHSIACDPVWCKPRRKHTRYHDAIAPDQCCDVFMAGRIFAASPWVSLAPQKCAGYPRWRRITSPSDSLEATPDPTMLEAQQACAWADPSDRSTLYEPYLCWLRQCCSTSPSPSYISTRASQSVPLTVLRASAYSSQICHRLRSKPWPNLNIASGTTGDVSSPVSCSACLPSSMASTLASLAASRSVDVAPRLPVSKTQTHPGDAVFPRDLRL